MSNSNKRTSIIISVIMIIAIGGSTLISLFNPTSQAILPTPTPQPTLPPPIADLQSITFDVEYLHPSGIFSVAVPSGWTAATTIKNAGEASVNMNNGELLSVIQASVLLPQTEVNTTDDLNVFFNQTWLQSSWAQYGSWEEGARRVEGDKLVLDFNLVQGLRNYIARQVAWTDGDLIYSVRVITLENGSDMLKYIVDQLPNTIKANKQFLETPFDWSAYFDNVSHLVIRYPASWTLEDSAPGAPTTIGTAGITLRVEANDTPVADEAAARAWVEASRPGATVLSATAVERGDLTGYQVAYQIKTLDGDTESGVALLLNGTDGKLYVANARVQGTVDFGIAAADDAYNDLRTVLSTFAVLPDLNVTQ